MRSEDTERPRHLADLTGKICVVTGATSGLGLAVARRLYALNAHVILVGRNERAGQRIASVLQKRKLFRGAIEYVRADLSRPDAVRALADGVNTRWGRVDVIVNNAGARFDMFGETPEGIERTFATNHLGHFQLTLLLMDSILRAPAPRVITISSSSHVSANIRMGWCLRRETYDRRVAYANSKLANIVFGFSLADRFRSAGVSSNVVDPGIVVTNFARNNGIVSWMRHFGAHAIRNELMWPSTAARPIVHLAASPEMTGVTGKYFRAYQEVTPSDESLDRGVGDELWALSARLTDLERAFPLARSEEDSIPRGPDAHR